MIPVGTTQRTVSRKVVATALTAIGILVFAIANAVIPAAQAATHVYANGVSTPMGAEVSSNLRERIVGSEGNLRLGFGYVTVKEYNPAPGYKVHYQNTSPSGGTARTSHGSFPLVNAYSKCSWQWENLGGNAELTCSVRS